MVFIRVLLPALALAKVARYLFCQSWQLHERVVGAARFLSAASLRHALLKESLQFPNREKMDP
jgi:hypothetical protein